MAIKIKSLLNYHARLPMMFHRLGLLMLKNFMSSSAIVPSAPATYKPAMKKAPIMVNAAAIAIFGYASPAMLVGVSYGSI